MGNQVETELGVSTAESGVEWETVSIILRRLAIKGNFIPHVLVSPFEILEISTERNKNETHHRRKLRIRLTGNAGGGAPAINALAGTVDGVKGGRCLGGIKEAL